MNWNDAAEDFLRQVLAETPRPLREARENEIRSAAEQIASEQGTLRVGVSTVIAAWIQTTPEALREELPRQMERFGLDPEEYSHLFS